jgi:hypothetical protein
VTADQRASGGGGSAALRWLVIVIAVLAIVAMLGLVRGKPGVGGRAPHPGDLPRVIQTTSAFR